MPDPILYGPDYSAYVRTSRLAMEEKGVAYQWQQFDFLQGGMPAEQIRRHPFGKVPAFEHDGFSLYETSAITRYVDEVFEGPALQPGNPRERARMTQIIAIIDNYSYGPMVWGMAVERIFKPKLGQATDEQTIAKAIPKARTAVQALEALAGGDGFLVGNRLTLADLHAAPTFAYFNATADARALMAEAPKISRWWQAMNERPSMTKTAPQV